MAKVHDEFEQAILELRFKKGRDDGYDYQMWDGTWFYKLNYEGYAYVLYQTINIYVKPLTNLFKIYNKFRKGTAQIALHYDVPIAHFRDVEKFKVFIPILTDKLEDNE